MLPTWAKARHGGWTKFSSFRFQSITKVKAGFCHLHFSRVSDRGHTPPLALARYPADLPPSLVMRIDRVPHAGSVPGCNDEQSEPCVKGASSGRTDL
jgi:hypothetical protein